MWAFCSLMNSEGARRYYDAHRGKGQTHRRALRSLANRWVGILHGPAAPRVLLRTTGLATHGGGGRLTATGRGMSSSAFTRGRLQ